MEISKITKNRLEELILEGRRVDNRKPFQYRDIKVTFGVSCNAESSVIVELGSTKVAVGVKLDVAEPFRDSPNEGILITTMELGPIASDEFESGPPSAHATEMARIVDRGIRESGFIDFKKLCIKPKEAVWMIFLDIYALNDGGNILDAAALGAILALSKALMPKLDSESKVIYGELTKNKLPVVLEKTPFTISIFKLGSKFLVDPSSTEEKIVSSGITAAISFPKGKEPIINAMQKHGSLPLGLKEIDEIMDKAIEKSKFMKEKFISFLGKTKKEKKK